MPSASGLGLDVWTYRALRLPAIGSTLGIAATLGIVHLVIDATTVSVVLRTANIFDLTPQGAFALVLGYDLLAFGSQVLLGFIADRWSGPGTALRLGIALTVASVLGAAWHPMVALGLAGFGNALFHLGAGAVVLGRGLTKAAPAGIFVAPGAIGLAFGLTYGRLPGLGPLWPLALVAAAGWVSTWFLPMAEQHPTATTRPAGDAQHAAMGATAAAMTLLLSSIAVRSLVGLSATRGLSPSTWLLLGVPLAAFAGKSLGGYFADRWGWIRTSLGALLVAGPLIAFGNRHVGLLLLGLLLFQMTMPVTLTAVAQLMPRSLATAFGWTCLALIVGAIPTMFALTAPLCTRSMLLVWVLLGAVGVALGLRQVERLQRLRLVQNMHSRSS